MRQVLRSGGRQTYIEWAISMPQAKNLKLLKTLGASAALVPKYGHGTLADIVLGSTQKKNLVNTEEQGQGNRMKT